MEFKMKLQSLPFSVIESGRKSIELRLYDEKRKQIAVGDTIHFCLGLDFCLCFGSRFVDMFENLTVCQYHLARVDATWGNTAQFGGASGSVFSAICGMQIPRFTSVNLRNLHLHLTKNPFAGQPPHLRGVALVKMRRQEGLLPPQGFL